MSAITVTVVFALPDRALEIELRLAAGATVAEALARFPSEHLRDADLSHAPVGIFGRRVERDRVLADGDRIENLPAAFRGAESGAPAASAAAGASLRHGIFTPQTLGDPALDRVDLARRMNGAGMLTAGRNRGATGSATGMPRLLDGEITELKTLLDAARRGERSALDELFSLLYRELHQLAHARLARDKGFPLDTTSLVHESYLRCLKAQALDVVDRAHFLAYAAKVMRSIVVDVARQRQADRHGGDAAHLSLNTDLAESVHVSADQLVSIDDALHDLARIDERLVRVVEMRFFAGLTEQEVAEALGLTERTIRRDWEKAKLLLRAALA